MRVTQSNKHTEGGSGSSTAAGVSGKETRTTEGETRRQVMHLLLTLGPVTASTLGDHLGDVRISDTPTIVWHPMLSMHCVKQGAPMPFVRSRDSVFENFSIQ